jgi:hypothetical protein
MREVSDALLLNIAEVSASLIGLFLVGVSSMWRRGFVAPIRPVMWWRHISDSGASRLAMFESLTQVVAGGAGECNRCTRSRFLEAIGKGLV